MVDPLDESLSTRDKVVWEIGVDTGGTFTDCIAHSIDGRTRRAKVLSTSAIRGVLRSCDGCSMRIEIQLSLSDEVVAEFFRDFSIRLVSRASSSDKPLCVTAARRIEGQLIQFTLVQSEGNWTNKLESDFEGVFVDLVAPYSAPMLAARLAIDRPHPTSMGDCRICVGTTRGTNALLEGRTTPVTLFVNEGLEDILRIGDQRRLDIFAVAPSKPRRIERASIGVPVRMAADGTEVRPLDEELLRTTAIQAFDRGDRVAAVALLHSDSSHQRASSQEVRVGEILREVGFSWVSHSHRCGSTSRFEPRARACVVDAALSGPLGEFIQSLEVGANGSEILMMTSAGGLVPASAFQPRESLLSGPAGGVAAAAAVASSCGMGKCVTLDMGGTSADVARVDGAPELRDETILGSVILSSACVAIESVAAGGGSILWWDGESMRVGPTSAGSFPGPACYGAGGPLTLTDANLLLGRIDQSKLSIPFSNAAAEARALELNAKIASTQSGALTLAQMLEAFIAIADEAMASAIRSVTIRRGVDPTDHALVAFGGAGGLHACAVARRLGMRRVVIPADAGLLCASGISCAPISRIVSELVLARIDECDPPLFERFERLRLRALAEIRSLATDATNATVVRQSAMVRLRGHEESMEIDLPTCEGAARVVTVIESGFRSRFKEIYGFDAETTRVVEIERIRVQVEIPRISRTGERCAHIDDARGTVGPAIFGRPDSTAYLAQGWRASSHPSGAMVFTLDNAIAPAGAPLSQELIAARLASISADMGDQLRRTAVSPNIKDRLDFSCGLLDADGFLVVNAPHIPIHLGALGPCVRSILAHQSLGRGDVVVVNHPRFGGSHLPDLTVVTPIFTDSGVLAGFAANRAHHAEIGGTRPGSMPPDATNLAQEGVAIEPMLLVDRGVARFDRVEQLLRQGRLPSRMVADNLADLRAQVAANELALTRMRELLNEVGIDSLRTSYERMRDSARRASEGAIMDLPLHIPMIHERLDDGTLLCVGMSRDPLVPRLTIDFTSTASVHPRNLNAPLAVTRAAVMYSIRALVGKKLGVSGPAFPLNEGLLDPIDIVLPQGTILSPDFSGPPENCPACAIGQTETSQRLVDLLWRSLDLAACSQGTINNLLFGNADFGFYETIAGGAGATDQCAGESGIHTHISNTRITDPEVLERRYPVRLELFRIRANSGGIGQRRGGDGLVRRIRFLKPVELSFLSQHRIEEPYGLHGGGPGARGTQRIIRLDGRIEAVAGIVAAQMQVGDQFEVETPGGGGFGAAKPSE